ncbi:DNA polymerase IV [Capsulimonas corticalis]|uniref:DNA polymerase IV n=1 Tax=Capsulimonas corticalis TaxID=2219043 RepID=A0A402CN94_9BACT|nr:hypothetical protein [Capsulimonas corticalis]BDI33351.1 DNA polymerase IV [Capsulimonas corticalis]
MIVCFSVPALGVACEQARRPDLAGVPFALITDDGAIFAPSQLAAVRGVRPGQSISAARTFCPALVTLPYDHAAYQNRARLLWDIAAAESSTVEPVTPELFFLLAGRTFVLNDVSAFADAMAAAIGAPVLAGIGASKFSARRAAMLARPGESFTIAAGDELAHLGRVPIAEVAGVDAKSRARLEKLGVRTLGQAAAHNGKMPKDLRIVGGRLAALAMGRDGDRVRAAWPERSEEANTAFEDETEYLPLIDAALLRLSEKIAAKLQSRHEYCRTLSIQVGHARGVADCWERLILPASDAASIHRGARRLLERGRPAAGVLTLRLVAGELGSGSGLQLSLLDEYGAVMPAERDRKTAAALTYIRERWGGGAVITAEAMYEATKRALRTYPLGHQSREAVEVRLQDGTPAAFTGKKTRHTVARVQNSWRETDVFAETPSERQVWRVQTAAGALAELHEAGGAWTLHAMAD